MSLFTALEPYSPCRICTRNARKRATHEPHWRLIRHVRGLFHAQDLYCTRTKASDTGTGTPPPGEKVFTSMRFMSSLTSPYRVSVVPGTHESGRQPVPDPPRQPPNRSSRGRQCRISGWEGARNVLSQARKGPQCTISGLEGAHNVLFQVGTCPQSPISDKERAHNDRFEGNGLHLEALGELGFVLAPLICLGFGV